MPAGQRRAADPLEDALVALVRSRHGDVGVRSGHGREHRHGRPEVLGEVDPEVLDELVAEDQREHDEDHQGEQQGEERRREVPEEDSGSGSAVWPTRSPTEDGCSAIAEPSPVSLQVDVFEARPGLTERSDELHTTLECPAGQVDARQLSACRRRDRDATVLTHAGRRSAGIPSSGRASSLWNVIRVAAVCPSAERLGGALGDDQSVGDHGDAVGQVLRLVHVVGGQQHGLARARSGSRRSTTPAGAPTDRIRSWARP